MMQVSTANKAAVDIEVLVLPRFLAAPVGLRIRKMNSRSASSRRGSSFCYCSGPGRHFGALPLIGRRKVIDFLIVVVQGKMNVRMGNGCPLEFLEDMPHLHGVGLEKFASCRDIEEQVPDREVGAWRGGTVSCALMVVPSIRIRCPECLPGVGCAIRPGRQKRWRPGLHPEAHRSDVEEVIGTADLGGRMPLKAHSGRRSRTCRNHHPPG